MRDYLTIAVGLVLLTSLPLYAQQDNQTDGGGATTGGAGTSDAGIGGLETGSALERNTDFQNRDVGIVGGNNPASFTGQAGTDTTGGATSGLGAGAGGFGSFFNSFNQQLNQQSQNNDRSIRVPMRLGFAQVRPNPQVVIGRVARQLTKISHLANANSVAVVMEGKTAVLQGFVKSDHSRAIAERLALLEPGVSRVRNEIVVQQAVVAEELLNPLPPVLPPPN
ncbi:MAG: hypothetical protein ACI9G1_001172 [Pirellulaceae bacterium]|jgi:hypothetical protein